MVTLEQSAPTTFRRQVLLKSPEDTVADLRASPGEWFIIAAGEIIRRQTFSQTAHRIKEGTITAFRLDDGDGHYETIVESKPQPGDTEPMSRIFARWVSG